MCLDADEVTVDACVSLRDMSVKRINLERKTNYPILRMLAKSYTMFASSLHTSYRQSSIFPSNSNPRGKITKMTLRKAAEVVVVILSMEF